MLTVKVRKSVEAHSHWDPTRTQLSRYLDQHWRGYDLPVVLFNITDNPPAGVSTV